MAQDTKNRRFYWDSGTRRFRDDTGKFVSRTEVRSSVDAYVENVRADIKRVSEQLQSGRINLSQWQVELESIIKRAHTATGAIGAGGWKQTTSSGWSSIGARLRQEYGYLRNFTLELEQGLPLDGRFINRAMQYGQAAAQTYEAQLRRMDANSNQRLEERRILHAQHSCSDCIGYAAKGWQPMGVLPNVGEACQCKSACLCTFERRAKRVRT